MLTIFKFNRNKTNSKTIKNKSTGLDLYSALVLATNGLEKSKILPYLQYIYLKSSVEEIEIYSIMGIDHTVKLKVSNNLSFPVGEFLIDGIEIRRHFKRVAKIKQVDKKGNQFIFTLDKEREIQLKAITESDKYFTSLKEGIDSLFKLKAKRRKRLKLKNNVDKNIKFKLIFNILGNGVNKTYRFISKKNSKTVLTNLSINISSTQKNLYISFIGTNSFILGYYKKKINLKKDIDVSILLNRLAFTYIKRSNNLLKDIVFDVIINVKERIFILENDNISIDFLLFNGVYPNINEMIEKFKYSSVIEGEIEKNTIKKIKDDLKKIGKLDNEEIIHLGFSKSNDDGEDKGRISLSKINSVTKKENVSKISYIVKYKDFILRDGGDKLDIYNRYAGDILLKLDNLDTAVRVTDGEIVYMSQVNEESSYEVVFGGENI